MKSKTLDRRLADSRRGTSVGACQETLRAFGARLYDHLQHTHLLIKDNGGAVVAQSIQLIAGRTAQEYNQRKEHHGAF